MKRSKLSRRALHLKRMDEQARIVRERRTRQESTAWFGWHNAPLAEQLRVPMMPDECGYYWIW